MNTQPIDQPTETFFSHETLETPQPLSREGELILGKLFGYHWRTLSVTGVSTEDARAFAEKTVLPAYADVRHKTNQSRKQQQTPEALHNSHEMIRSRFIDVIGGASDEVLSEKYQKTAVSVRSSVTVMLRTLTGENSPYTPEYFRTSFSEQFPNAIVRGSTQYEHIAQASGALALGRPTRSRLESSSDESGDSSYRDALGQYLSEIGRTPLLTADQEIELAKRIEAGLMAQHTLDTASGSTPQESAELEWIAADGIAAKEHFLAANLRLVVSIVRKYRSGEPHFLLDRIQEGNIGLTRAVEKFDYKQGYKFSTYATWWVKQALTRYMDERERTVKIPVHLGEEIRSMQATQRILVSELEREPTPKEIADRMNMNRHAKRAEQGSTRKVTEMTPERVNDLVDWSRPPISLDQPVGDESGADYYNLIESGSLTTKAETTADTELLSELHELVEFLDERHAYVIKLRYGMLTGTTETYTDIGKRLGVSHERARQIEREAVAKLRALAEQNLAS